MKLNILTRTACLGGAVIFHKFGNKHNFFSHAKVRVDLFLDIINTKINKPNFNIINDWLARRDMEGVYKQAADLSWLECSVQPDFLIMDSYSELTDKRFHYTEENFDFCGLYGDLDRVKCKNKLQHLGLLEPDNLQNKYDQFFTYVRNQWKNTPIIFIHFPTTFEARKKYIIQGKMIMQALNNLSPQYQIQNIYAQPEEIENAGDGDTYHLSDQTAKFLAQKIQI